MISDIHWCPYQGSYGNSLSLYDEHTCVVCDSYYSIDSFFVVLLILLVHIIIARHWPQVALLS